MAPADAPGPVGAPHTPGAPPTSFVGRAADLVALADVLERGRLLTLLGPPGMGKTRLARQHAADLAASGAEVVFCDLTEATSTDGICAALAGALGVPMTSANAAEGAGAALIAPIAARGPALFVLDNFEQVVELAASTLGVWLAATPEARFLVTSRERLGLAGEALFDLGPLAFAADAGGSDAVRLFVERARLVQRDYAPQPDEAATIAELVKQLDGLPLAIELCAARIRVLSPAQMLAKMSRRFELLSAEVRAAVDPSRARRGAALWQAIESSWTQLAAEERQVLVAASVFRGGFDLEAIESVAAEGAAAGWVLDAVQRLVDKSLIRAEDPGGGSGPRFSMYLAIRDFAGRMLRESGAGDEVAARHARHYLRRGAALAALAEGPSATEVHAWLGREMENLRVVHRRALTERGRAHARGPAAAVSAALAVSPRIEMRGPFALGLTMLDESLEAAGESLEAPLLVRALTAKGRFLRLSGRTPGAIAVLERAREAATALGDRALLGAALMELGVALVADNDWRRGRSTSELAVEIFRALDDRARQGQALFWLADSYFYVDDLDEAEHRYEEALDLLREVGDRVSEAVALGRLGTVAMERGDHETARARYTESVAIHRGAGDRRWEGPTLGYLAILEQDAGRLAEARAHYDTALEQVRRIGNARHEAIFLAYLGSCLMEQGRLADARAALRRAIPMLDRCALPTTAALARGALGALSADSGEVQAAVILFAEAAANLAGMEEQSFTIAALALHRGHLDLALARAAAAAGESIQASEHRQEARRRLREAPGPLGAQTDVRFARRELVRAIEAEPALGQAAAAPDFAADVLVIEPTGAWFRPPHGKTVEVGHRQPLRHLLAELYRQRRARPGEPVASEVLIRRAWPEEQGRDAVTVNRLRVAVSALRKLGLSRAILTRPGGYLLDPGIQLQAPDPASARDLDDPSGGPVSDPG